MTTPSDKSGRAATLIPYARSILQAMKENGYRGTVWDDVLNEYEKATAPLPETGTHTDHPLRHFDRTCPACTEGDTPRPGRPVMEEGNLSGWSVYVTSLERYTDQLEQLYGAACLQLQARGDKAVALSAKPLSGVKK